MTRLAPPNERFQSLSAHFLALTMACLLYTSRCV